MRRLPLLALAFATVPLPATAQPAAWAQDRREPMCVFDGLMAISPGAAPEPSQMEGIRRGCRERFGWTEAQVNRGTMVAMIMLDMLVAQREARSAGVDQATIDAVRNSFSGADADTLGQPGQPLTDQGNATIRRIAERVRERGLSGEPGRKATRAVLLQMMATTIISGFAQEIMTAPPS